MDIANRWFSTSVRDARAGAVAGGASQGREPSSETSLPECERAYGNALRLQ